jgi:hypothetical protein
MSSTGRDVFLSHASEDKDRYVRPFAEELARRGITYWLDEAEIRWGDRITQRIDEGLREARYVIVFLSHTFLGRNWPESELRAALNKETTTGTVVVLPLILGDPSAVLDQYPFLRDKLYLRWAEPLSSIVEQLEAVIPRPPVSSTGQKAEPMMRTARNVCPSEDRRETYSAQHHFQQWIANKEQALIMIGLICCLWGALPKWASQTGLLVALFPGNIRNGISSFANWTTLLILFLVILYSLINSGRILSELRQPLSDGRSGHPVVRKISFAAILIAYVTISYEAITMRRIWAANQDTQVIWLLGMIANLTFLLYYYENSISRPVAQITFKSLGLLSFLLGIYNLGYMFFGKFDAGDITWAILSGALPGGCAVSLGGIMLFISGLSLPRRE